MVEDNPADVDLVREALEEYAVRCELVLTRDGEHALEFIEGVEMGKTHCPDLVILDLNLPKKPGQEVLRRVRASLKCNHVPVVVLTSSDSQKDKEDTAGLGASTYLLKPPRLSEFLKLGEAFKRMLGCDSD